ncbi:UNVERIFIED_CONTAM: hypothetical protein PYX00_005606 [Menopon gallinae]|uniref:Sodefrin-like factor n=1 Tax=Menopon gallinae TaxID=328185 RepID=A0AAW2HS28_9NEOP
MLMPESFLLLALFDYCGGIMCYFCTDSENPNESESENCKFYVECPPDVPGCLTLSIEDETKPSLVRTCSFIEGCNETVITMMNVPYLAVRKCEFCNTDLCNSACELRIATASKTRRNIDRAHIAYIQISTEHSK